MINKVGEAAEATGTERELKPQDSDPKEPDAEPKGYTDLEKKVIKALRERQTEHASTKHRRLRLHC